MAANTTYVPLFLTGWLQLVAPEQCFDEFFVKFNFLDADAMKMLKQSTVLNWKQLMMAIFSAHEWSKKIRGLQYFFSSLHCCAVAIPALLIVSAYLISVPCLKIFISKCLGYAIICGSFIVKVPQIIKIWKSKSGEGISLASVSLELLAISATWAYGVGHKFPFSSYGEALFLAIQTSSIAFLVLHYANQTVTGLVYVSVYVACMAFLLSPAAPMALLTLLQAANIFVASFSKCIQALANYRNGSTGQLSFVTVYMLFLGSCARIFTSIQETGDAMVIASYCLTSICNGIIAGQLLYYWNSQKVQHKRSVTKKIS